ncbi:hypothetical protein J2T02_002017 [Chitinophaga terrae (ex Kim and Jung 2007)]|nr:hypothetical protein [Chitinophaga terrae (ex Kim and Jung 2007)]
MDDDTKMLCYGWKDQLFQGEADKLGEWPDKA